MSTSTVPPLLQAPVHCTCLCRPAPHQVQVQRPKRAAGCCCSRAQPSRQVPRAGEGTAATGSHRLRSSGACCRGWCTGLRCGCCGVAWRGMCVLDRKSREARQRATSTALCSTKQLQQLTSAEQVKASPQTLHTNHCTFKHPVQAGLHDRRRQRDCGVGCCCCSAAASAAASAALAGAGAADALACCRRGSSLRGKGLL